MSGNRMQFFGVLCLVFSFNGCEARSVPVRGIANGTHGDKEVKSPEMIYVPAGKFQRDGSPSNVAEVDDFLISKYEISRELYIEVTGQGYVGRFGSIDGAPIDGVSWYDALMFCNELSVITGKTPVYSIQDENDGTYRTDQWGPIPDEASLRWDTVRIDRGASGFRLPTVDEWMWAAMGATAGKYFPMVILEREEFSDGVYRSGYMKPGALGYMPEMSQANAGRFGWYSTNSKNRLNPSGRREANCLGIYDMSGNLQEWCQDVHQTIKTENVVKRICKGGSWKKGSPHMALRHASSCEPWVREETCGLRLVCRP